MAPYTGQGHYLGHGVFAESQPLVRNTNQSGKIQQFKRQLRCPSALCFWPTNFPILPTGESYSSPSLLFCASPPFPSHTQSCHEVYDPNTGQHQGDVATSPCTNKILLQQRSSFQPLFTEIITTKDPEGNHSSMLHTLNSSLLGKKPHSVLRHTKMQITSVLYVMKWKTKGEKSNHSLSCRRKREREWHVCFFCPAQGNFYLQGALNPLCCSIKFTADLSTDCCSAKKEQSRLRVVHRVNGHGPVQTCRQPREGKEEKEERDAAGLDQFGIAIMCSVMSHASTDTKSCAGASALR